MVINKTFGLLAVSAAALLMTGCASTFNTAENAEFSCGLPKGQTCKSPSNVYKSTNGEIVSEAPDAKDNGNTKTAKTTVIGSIATTTIGPRPVREPAQVVRIWIAPWVDRADNLNLAQYQFAEIKPRTWSVGLKESTGSGYVIPHQALGNISAVVPTTSEEPAAKKETRIEPRASEKTSSANPFAGAIDAAMGSKRGNPDLPQ